MELKQITRNVYYLPNPTNIGVVKDDSGVILIDSGLDEDVAKKVLRILEAEELVPKAVINTHSHADHCGADAWIKEKTKAKIFAPEIEADIIQHPQLEPFLLFSGADPIEDLKNKFLMAKPCQVDYVIKNSERKLTFDKIELEVVPLPGHSLNQIGIEVDDVLFCADSVFSKNVLDRYKVPYVADVVKLKETLALLNKSNYEYYVPSHAEPTNNITELVDINLETAKIIEEYILAALSNKKTTEQVLKTVCDNFKLEIKTAQQYYLINTGIMAHLSSLHKRGVLKFGIKENSVYWEKMR